jgi:hypothetical protein
MTVYLSLNGWHPSGVRYHLKAREHQKLSPHPRTEAPLPASDEPVVPAAVRVRTRLTMGKSKSKGAKFAAVKKIISKKTIQK